jgi:hypothetical protein
MHAIHLSVVVLTVIASYLLSRITSIQGPFEAATALPTYFSI